MNPIVKYTADENDVLSFNLNNTNVSIANSLRRIILSEIDLIVFKPFPYENGNCVFYQNTSRLNNELLNIDIKKKLILQLIEFSQAGDATGHQILQFYYDLVSCLL